MKSLGVLKDLTSKMKQQTKGGDWVKKGDLEREREAKYLEDQHKREEERKQRQEEKLKEI